MNMNAAKLVREALKARTRAYVPYSNFAVGAALLTKSGTVYHGCNIENASYTPTNCAERTAIFTAVCAGEREFEAIAIVGGSKNAQTLSECFPCGVCRQVLTEFCPPEFPVIIATDEQQYHVYTLENLMPHSFGPSDLNP